MADDRTVEVRATGSPATVDRLIAAIRGMDLEHITTRGPYQLDNGRVEFYAEVRLADERDSDDDRR